MGLLRLIHGIARQITAQDPGTGADVPQVGDAINNAIRVSIQSAPFNNQDLVLIASQTVASSAADVSADVANLFWSNAVIYLNITQASGTGGLTLNLQFKDPASGNYITVYTATTAYITTGLRAFAFGLATNWANSNLQADTSTALARTWRVQITKGDASSYTYSVGASLMGM